MRFDLVDLQLFVAVAETRSITNGAQRVHLALASGSERIKGLEDAFGVALLTRGRRGVELTPAGESLLDHARVVLHNVEAMRGDLARLCPWSEGYRPLPRQHIRAFGISAEDTGCLSGGASSHFDRRRRTRKRRDCPRHRHRGGRSRARRRTRACRQYRADAVQRRSLVLVAAREDELASRRQVDFSEVVKRDFVGLISSIALHAHISGHAARLGARLRFRARLNSFDAIGQMVAAGIGIGVMPEVAAKRCARSMKINVIRIRDSWANRKLVICARNSGAAQACATIGGAPAQICAPLKLKGRGNAEGHLPVARPAALMTRAHFWVSVPM